MAISSISSPLASVPSPSSAVPTASAPATAASAAAAGSGGGSGASSAAFRQVVSQYNIHEISPSQFSAMIQQLSSAGAISASDQQALTQMRSVMDASGASPDEPLDLVQFFQSNAKTAASSSGSNSSPANTAAANSTAQQQLAWAQKLAAIQSSSASSGQQGVDATV